MQLSFGQAIAGGGIVLICLGGGIAVYGEVAQRAARNQWNASRRPIVKQASVKKALNKSLLAKASPLARPGIPPLGGKPTKPPSIAERGGTLEEMVRQEQDVIARLSCPRLHKELFVLVDRKENLSRGPVWLPVTSPPGQSGNAVMAGHRDTHFRFLKDVKVGDVFEVESGTAKSSYAVTALQIVSIKDRRLLAPQERGMLTLVTCYPFYYIGKAPKRYIVQAELVSTVPGTETIQALSKKELKSEVSSPGGIQ